MLQGHPGYPSLPSIPGLSPPNTAPPGQHVGPRRCWMCNLTTNAGNRTFTNFGFHPVRWETCEPGLFSALLYWCAPKLRVLWACPPEISGSQQRQTCWGGTTVQPTKIGGHCQTHLISEVLVPPTKMRI